MSTQTITRSLYLLLATLLMTAAITARASAQAAPGAPGNPPPCGNAQWLAGPLSDPGVWGAATARDAQGNVWVIGGDAANWQPIVNSRIYNVFTNSWQNGPPLPVPVARAAAGAIDNKLYVAGGALGGPNMSNQLQILDLGSNTWQIGAPLPVPGLAGAAGATVNGFFYVMGGDNGQGASDQVLRYDPYADTWTLATPLPAPRTHAAATAANGRIYVFGGLDAGGQTLDQPLSYDPYTQQWTLLPPASLGGLGNFPGLSPYGANALIATDGGTAGGMPSNSTHIFTFDTGTWSAGPPLLLHMLGAAQDTLADGRVFLYGGLLSPNNVSDQSAMLLPQAPCPTSTPTDVPTWITATLTVAPTVPPASSPTPGGTATATPTPGLVSISGTIYANYPDPADALGGAYVFACSVGGTCTTHAVLSDFAGHYSLINLAAGSYYVFVNPPGNSYALPNEIGPLVAHGNLAGQNVLLHDAARLPPGTTLEPDQIGGGVPNVSWEVPLTLTTQGCVGGSASYVIYQDGVAKARGGLTEGPAGTFTAHIAPLDTVPDLHGSVRFVITITCPGGPTITIAFDCYIDPSGHVRTMDGYAIPGATVTLFRADDASGPFVAVPDGSGMMSPMNRHNADMTTAAGHFGWDVIAGYYKVRAAKAGCYAPGNPSQAYVESDVMAIPPPVADLDLRLACPGPAFGDVHPSDYFYNPVEYLASMGFVSGYGDGTFRPYGDVTRGQLAKIVASAAGFGAPAGGQRFADVPSGHPFYVWVEAMAARAIISGYACGGPGESCDAQQRPYFRPYVNVTRGQLAKIMANAAGLNAAVTGQTFADIPASQPFYLYIERAAGQGLVGGYGCGAAGEPCDAGHRPYFRPQHPATRGQTAKIIAATTFPDYAPAP